MLGAAIQHSSPHKTESQHLLARGGYHIRNKGGTTRRGLLWPNVLRVRRKAERQLCKAEGRFSFLFSSIGADICHRCLDFSCSIKAYREYPLAVNTLSLSEGDFLQRRPDFS